MREEISLCLSPPLPPSVPHSILSPPVIFVADEAEPNVYDRWDGRGKWCRPSPICICSVAGPALVSYKAAEHWTAGGACGGDGCWRERYPRSPIGAIIRKSCKKLPSPQRISLVSPSAPQTSSTSARGCTQCCDTRVTQSKLSEGVEVCFFLAGRVRVKVIFDCDLQFSAARRLILACFF